MTLIYILYNIYFIQLDYIIIYYYRLFIIISNYRITLIVLPHPQADGTRDTHSQLSMSQLHRQQDGSIVRCDAFNNVGSSSSQPLTVNMTIRVKCM